MLLSKGRTQENRQLYCRCFLEFFISRDSEKSAMRWYLAEKGGEYENYTNS